MGCPTGLDNLTAFPIQSRGAGLGGLLDNQPQRGRIMNSETGQIDFLDTGPAPRTTTIETGQTYKHIGGEFQIEITGITEDKVFYKSRRGEFEDLHVIQREGFEASISNGRYTLLNKGGRQ